MPPAAAAAQGRAAVAAAKQATAALPGPKALCHRRIEWRALSEPGGAAGAQTDVSPSLNSDAYSRGEPAGRCMHRLLQIAKGQYDRGIQFLSGALAALGATSTGVCLRPPPLQHNLSTSLHHKGSLGLPPSSPANMHLAPAPIGAPSARRLPFGGRLSAGSGRGSRLRRRSGMPPSARGTSGGESRPT